MFELDSDVIRYHLYDKNSLADSAEYIIAKAGLTPATLLRMVYREIARTGKIPVNIQISDEILQFTFTIRVKYQQKIGGIFMTNYHADFFDLVLILLLMTQLFLFMEDWFKVNYIANIVNTSYNISYKANMIW